jgi:hypothetical protein
MQQKKDKSSKVKIFVGYYKPNFIFESDVYQPIKTSPFDWEDQPDILSDATGINIAEKNQYYGELSGHYWVWKNFLPKTDAEYVGYCHYRRFLDFGITPMEFPPFKPIYMTNFKKIFKKYTEEHILNCIENYDIVLPNKFPIQPNVYEQYIKWHPQNDFDLAMFIIREIYPEYLDTAIKVISDVEMYTCLQFIMKKELVNEYMEWIFNILFLLEQRTDWNQYVKYLDVRTPAFIAERLFNIWLAYNIEKRNLKVLNTTSILVVGKGCGLSPSKVYVSKYKALVQYYNEVNRNNL